MRKDQKVPGEAGISSTIIIKMNIIPYCQIYYYNMIDNLRCQEIYG
jgi:hypothetical protein